MPRKICKQLMFLSGTPLLLCVVFAVVLLDTATSESLDWVTHSSGDEDVVGRRGVRFHSLCTYDRTVGSEKLL